MRVLVTSEDRAFSLSTLEGGNLPVILGPCDKFHIIDVQFQTVAAKFPALRAEHHGARLRLSGSSWSTNPPSPCSIETCNIRGNVLLDQRRISNGLCEVRENAGRRMAVYILKRGVIAVEYINFVIGAQFKAVTVSLSVGHCP